MFGENSALKDKKGSLLVLQQAPFFRDTGSEVQSHLTLEQASTGLAWHLTEWGASVDVEGPTAAREPWNGVIQDILCIDAHLKALGFRDPERLAQVGIEAPAAQSDDG